MSDAKVQSHVALRGDQPVRELYGLAWTQPAFSSLPRRRRRVGSSSRNSRTARTLPSPGAADQTVGSAGGACIPVHVRGRRRYCARRAAELFDRDDALNARGDWRPERQSGSLQSRSRPSAGTLLRGRFDVRSAKFADEKAFGECSPTSRRSRSRRSTKDSHPARGSSGVPLEIRHGCCINSSPCFTPHVGTDLPWAITQVLMTASRLGVAARTSPTWSAAYAVLETGEPTQSTRAAGRDPRRASGLAAQHAAWLSAPRRRQTRLPTASSASCWRGGGPSPQTWSRSQERWVAQPSAAGLGNAEVLVSALDEYLTSPFSGK